MQIAFEFFNEQFPSHKKSKNPDFQHRSIWIGMWPDCTEAIVMADRILLPARDLTYF